MTSRAELSNAIRLHRTGEHAMAARLYEAILSSEPEHVDALHLLGVLRQQQGQLTQAVELCGKAVALRPDEATFHTSLAEAHRALRQFEQAVVHGRIALHLRHEYPEAHNNLGLALLALGQTAEAADQFKAALASRPNFFEARMNLGELLLELGKAEEALPHCRQAVTLSPSFPHAHNTLGEALRPWDGFRRQSRATPMRSGSGRDLVGLMPISASHCDKTAAFKNPLPGSDAPPNSSPRTLSSGAITLMH